MLPYKVVDDKTIIGRCNYDNLSHSAKLLVLVTVTLCTACVVCTCDVLKWPSKALTSSIVHTSDNENNDNVNYEVFVKTELSIDD